MRKHPQLAYDMLYPIFYLRPALDIPYCHHEWWDGSGYHAGKGREYSYGSADFHRGRYLGRPHQDRRYRPESERRWTAAGDGLPVEQAGKKLDPRVVRVFLHLLESESRQAFT